MIPKSFFKYCFNYFGVLREQVLLYFYLINCSLFYFFLLCRAITLPLIGCIYSRSLSKLRLHATADLCESCGRASISRKLEVGGRLEGT